MTVVPPRPIGRSPVTVSPVASRPAALWLVALAALTLLRLLVAGLAPLSPDEAYYWVWSRAPAPGYLDHPPMVAAWIGAGTRLAGEGALGVRLLGPLSAAAGSLLLAHAAEGLFPGRGAGVRAAVLLNATLLLGVGAVTMTPDTPLVLFWTAALWALVRILRTGRGVWWLAVGAAAGGALLSKYTGVLLGAGVLIWLAWVPPLRRWLRDPWPYAGGAVAVALFAPVAIWNAGHGWASFVKQGGRAGDWDPAEALRHLSELLGGQIGLATPLVFALFAAGALAAARRLPARDPAWTLLAALILPGAAVFVQHALGDRVQGNWPAVLYPAAAVAAGALDGRPWRRLWRPAAVLGFVLTGLVYVQTVAAPLPLPRRLDPGLARLAGWPELAREADELRAREGAAYLAAESYALASELAWHAPPGVAVLGVEERWRLFDLPRPDDAAPTGDAGRAGLLVQSTRRSEPPDPARWRDVREVGRLVRARAGVVAEEYRVYRATRREDAPAVLLPRPTQARQASPDPE